MRPRAREIVARGGVLVIAHRGASADAPENTLRAFRLGLEAGADLVELDTRHSADDVPMVFHDKDLGRTTDAVSVWGKGKLRFEERTQAELERLDAGSWFDPRYAAGTIHIPTLAQALDVIQPEGTTLIERKTGDAATLLTLLEERGAVERVVVQAFDWPFLAACRARSPKLVLAALGSRALPPARLEEAVAAGASVMGWNHKHVNAALVRRVHERGLKLWVYTVNDDRRALELVALGVDGLITDRPAGIRQALQRATK
ncbi:MAG: glycerophosphodiester phosphodiesterase family protein [Planctomycetota bacterium]|nr:glycerophosphodiester phosphodiesterase family protein [Planctomycetota bacterium]